MKSDWEQRAEAFLRDTDFHLGFLPTEQSHPGTRGLAETLQRGDVEAGVRMLQAVDEDIAARANVWFDSPAFSRLTSRMTAALRNGGRVCFSGCGATGRLSILLEARWRRFWKDAAARHEDLAEPCRQAADRVISIMTGGDYALIRSVENFEDYVSFGREQVREAGIGAGDVLVGISEGGETSSVIGTILEALDRGASAFFVFNNPAHLLRSRIERSRRVIDDPRVTVLDLSTGPMAVAGSTRMQATTAELLVVGAALERALAGCVTDLPPLHPIRDEIRAGTNTDYADGFRKLLDDLGSDASVNAIASWVRYEAQLYRSKGLMTYYADECLLDIFTDTTERNPTFMLPPFRKRDDRVSPPPWAFAKHPFLPTEQVWTHVLGRTPRCIEWTPEIYVRLGADAAIAADPPGIGLSELLKFPIGCEPDPSRWEGRDNAAMLVALDREMATSDGAAAPAAAGFARCARPFARRAAVILRTDGPDAPPLPEPLPVDTMWTVGCALPATPLMLWERLALKLIFNTVSTATMGCVGRLVSNWMAHVEPTNKKLIDRGSRLISELGGIDYASACRLLFRTMDDIRRSCPPDRERPSPVAAALRALRESGRQDA